jgi:hypothetical protein
MAVGTLKNQFFATESPELTARIGAALVRHAIVLQFKQNRTPPETLWMNAVFGAQYETMLSRAVRYCAALPAVYTAEDMTDISIPDSVLLSAVPNLPAALAPLA